MDCMHCNKPIEASKSNRKRIFCDDKCRKAHKRKLAKLQSGQNPKRTELKALSGQHGVCKYCGAKIDDILVCCGPCAWERPAVLPSRPDWQYKGLILTGGYTMTDYEREHYTGVAEAVMARQEPG